MFNVKVFAMQDVQQAGQPAGLTNTNYYINAYVTYVDKKLWQYSVNANWTKHHSEGKLANTSVVCKE